MGRRLWALAVLAAACQVTPPVRVVDASEGVEAELRESLGTTSLFAERSGLTFIGTRRFLGPDGVDSAAPQPVTLAFHPTGKFLLSVGAEEASVTKGYDGRVAWSVDPYGVSRELGLGSRETQLADGILRTSLWLTPGQEPFDVEADDENTTVDELAFTLTRLRDPLAVTLRVRRDSGRPSSFSMLRSGRERSVLFGDWREIGGLWSPFQITECSGGTPVHVDQFDSRTIGTPRTFEMPRSQPRDTEFDSAEGAGSMARVETRIDRGGRFYVRSTIDQETSAWMLLDTGFGTHAIHAPLAETLGIMTEQAASLLGVSGEGAGKWCEAGFLRVGRLTQRSPRLVAIDTTFLTERAGFPVAGVLGAPLFERALITLDESRGRVTIDDPSSRTARRTGTGMLVRMDGASPCVNGKITALGKVTPPLWFRLDTGSDDSVTVAEWASSEYGLVGERSTLRTTRLEGAFGVILGWRRVLERIDLGDPGSPGLMLLNPEVTLLRGGEAGPLSDPWLAGNVGTRAMLGCKLIFDLPGRRIYVSADQG